MVESIQNQMIYEFKQFVERQNVQIPDVFMVQFVENYLNKDRMFSSEYIYDWFGRQYYTRYDNFTKALIKILPQSLYKKRSFAVEEQVSKPKQNGGQNKIVYEVSYMGMKMMAIHNDHNIALYYLQLEDLVFRFFENQQSEKIKSYQITIQSMKQHCIIYRINVYDEQGKEIEKYYVGSTTKQKQRLLAHYYDSSNPYVNDFIKSGRKVTYTILYQFSYLIKSERNEIEQRYINKIPKEKSLNIKAVYTLTLTEEIDNGVSQMQQPIDIVLTAGNQTITEETKINTEQQFSDQLQRQRNTFEDNAHQLKQYIDENKSYPNKRHECKLSQRLGYFLSDIRSCYTNKNLVISEERIMLINRLIPGFVWATKDDKFTKSVDSLKEFYDQYKFWPRRVNKDASDHEKKLGKFVQHIRESYQKKDIIGAKLSYILDDYRLQYLLEMVPDFIFSVDKQGQYIEIAERLNTYIQINNRLPRRSGNTRDQEEVSLGSFIHNLQQSIKLNRSTLPEILQTLDQYCPRFNYNDLSIKSE